MLYICNHERKNVVNLSLFVCLTTPSNMIPPAQWYESPYTHGTKTVLHTCHERPSPWPWTPSAAHSCVWAGTPGLDLPSGTPARSTGSVLAYSMVNVNHIMHTANSGGHVNKSMIIFHFVWKSFMHKYQQRICNSIFFIVIFVDLSITSLETWTWNPTIGELLTAAVSWKHNSSVWVHYDL